MNIARTSRGLVQKATKSQATVALYGWNSILSLLTKQQVLLNLSPVPLDSFFPRSPFLLCIHQDGKHSTSQFRASRCTNTAQSSPFDISMPPR